MLAILKVCLVNYYLAQRKFHLVDQLSLGVAWFRGRSVATCLEEATKLITGARSISVMKIG